MITELGYAVGVLISILCAVLLVRSYLRARTPLLLWCSLCFAGLALNNVLLFADLFVVPEIDLEIWRSLTALVALSLMLIGLIWEEA
jgi:Family of unknown function (DUF5985)